MRDLIEIGTTKSHEIMMIALKAGGEARVGETTTTLGEGNRLHVGYTSQSRDLDASTSRLPTEATLYVPADAKFTAWQVLALWEVNRSLVFQCGSVWWGRETGAIFVNPTRDDENGWVAQDGVDARFLSGREPFILVQPEMPERDVFDKPMPDDVVVDDEGVRWRIASVNPENGRVDLQRVPLNGWSGAAWAGMADRFTVVHRAEPTNDE